MTTTTITAALSSLIRKLECVTKRGCVHIMFDHFNYLFTGNSKRLENMQGVCEQMICILFFLPSTLFIYTICFCLLRLYVMYYTVYKHVISNVYLSMPCYAFFPLAIFYGLPLYYYSICTTCVYVCIPCILHVTLVPLLFSFCPPVPGHSLWPMLGQSERMPIQ